MRNSYTSFHFQSLFIHGDQLIVLGLVSSKKIGSLERHYNVDLLNVEPCHYGRASERSLTQLCLDRNRDNVDFGRIDKSKMSRFVSDLLVFRLSDEVAENRLN